MSNNFKPLYTQVAEQLAAQLKAGTSPLQQPHREDGSQTFVRPVNPFTGKGYSALNALNMGLKGYDSPYWMSLSDASFNKLKVNAGEKGTLISFRKTSDIEAVRDVEGQKIKGENGETQTRTIRHEKPQKATPFLFNAAQLKDTAPLEALPQSKPAQDVMYPPDRAEKLIADSGATIIHGGNEAYYDKTRDAIFLPEPHTFNNEQKCYQAAIHQLVHWTGHESRLNRSMEGKFGSIEYGKEELRAAIASMLIGTEIGISHHFPHHSAYSNGWAKGLTDRPYEMAAIANDAQKAVSLLLGYGQKREQKKTEAQSNTLNKGEAINYNNITHTIVAKKKDVVTIQRADTGEKFKAGPNDKVYQNLVEARNNPLAQENKQGQDQQQDQEPELAAEMQTSPKIGR